jgi:2,4-dienoyl-CoA reductase-like NADH-dependent reductase (Old Yellow Enzyme family)
MSVLLSTTFRPGKANRPGSALNGAPSSAPAASSAHRIARAIRALDCDGVSMARPLLANPDLPNNLKAGWDGPMNPPCTYCNRCLLNVLENPLGCYDESRFENRGGYDRMIAEGMDIFEDEVGQ